MKLRTQICKVRRWYQFEHEPSRKHPQIHKCPTESYWVLLEPDGTSIVRIIFTILHNTSEYFTFFTAVPPWPLLSRRSLSKYVTSTDSESGSFDREVCNSGDSDQSIAHCSSGKKVTETVRNPKAMRSCANVKAINQCLNSIVNHVSYTHICSHENRTRWTKIEEPCIWRPVEWVAIQTYPTAFRDTQTTTVKFPQNACKMPVALAGAGIGKRPNNLRVWGEIRKNLCLLRCCIAQGQEYIRQLRSTEAPRTTMDNSDNKKALKNVSRSVKKVLKSLKRRKTLVKS